jgi:hypothetical protein
MPDPLGLHFETQEDDEKVILLLRAHRFTNLVWIATVIVLAVLGLFITIFSLFFPSILSPVDIILLLFVWWLLLGGFSLQRFLFWYFNVYIVTNKKIIDVDFLNLFYKQISETALENVQDSTHQANGFFQNHFDYGNLEVQTAGEKENFEFINIPDPDGVQEKIMEFSEAAKKAIGFHGI